MRPTERIGKVFDLLRREQDPSYLGLVADFLAAHYFKEEHGGYPAYAVEQVGGDVVLAKKKILVFVTPVLCEWPDPANREPVASLWFLACDQADDQTSFAVEIELVVEQLQLPMPSAEARDPGGDRVLAGDPLALTMKAVRVELAGDSPAAGYPEPLPAEGIRFSVGEFTNGEHSPVYEFAMAGIVPLLALSAVREDRDPSPTFAKELEAMRQEIEGPGEDA
jgi:hypothetical protein